MVLVPLYLLVINTYALSIRPDEQVRIDSIIILKNWRTKDAIIQTELGIAPGDFVKRSAIDTAMIRVWNIGNFAKVSYQLDTIDGAKNLLTVVAQDALTIVPILSFDGNKKDWNLSLGVTDNNFLGKNIRMHLGGTLGTNQNTFSLGVVIPRQLLYKNMSVSGNASYGYATNYQFVDRERTSAIAYSIQQISGGISNPWHEDFKYRFSPNFGWSLFRHKTDSSLVDPELEFSGNYTVNYLGLSLGESVGYIHRQRHQRNGFEMSLGIGAGIGLDENSPFYYAVNYGLRFYKLVNPVLQLTAEYSTGYTSTDLPSLIYYKGPGDVKGILTGEISGKAFYTALLGWNLTYINRDWFALEQSFYFNWGNGKDNYMDIYKSNPLYGVGTGFFMNIPMIPWLGMRVFFTYSGKNSNWLGLEL